MWEYAKASTESNKIKCKFFHRPFTTSMMWFKYHFAKILKDIEICVSIFDVIRETVAKVVVDLMSKR